MSGLIESHKRMKEGKVAPVIHAAAIAYGFVFLHPFEDGNGRIHRFLIHNILSLKGMVPRGLMFPVSAVMLKNPADYDINSCLSYGCKILLFIGNTNSGISDKLACSLFFVGQKFNKMEHFNMALALVQAATQLHDATRAVCNQYVGS